MSNSDNNIIFHRFVKKALTFVLSVQEIFYSLKKKTLSQDSLLDLKCPPQSTCGSSAPRMVVLLGTVGTLRGQCRSQPVELPWEVVGLGWWRSLKVAPDPACSPIL